MRLALNIGFWAQGHDDEQLALAQEADRLGYDSVWTAEAYGSDAATPNAWLAAQTSRIHLGSAVFQIPGRTPANAAMTAATLDVLSHGRFRLGLGVSGPQVSEGWHGVRFDRPLQRTREYVDIVRMALSGQRVAYTGEFFTLPLPDGPGKPLQTTAKGVRADLPIYLAAIGPRNLELAGEIADGWLGIFFSPEFADEQLTHLRTGRARVGKTLEGFDVLPSVPLVIGDDVAACADELRANAALYVGGMGSREQNFYNRLACAMGFETAAAQVQELFLAREYRQAAAAVPFEFIDRTSLIGPIDRVRERLHAYAASGVTTLAVSLPAGSLESRVAALGSLSDACAAEGLLTS